MMADARDPLGSPTEAAGWLDEHGDALYRFARARVGSRDLAEDLVQDTFLAALRASDRFQGRSSRRTWLLSILRRKIADHYRRPSTTDPEPILSRFFRDDGHWLRAPSPWKSPLEALVAEEFRLVLDGCLGRLPPPLADVFVRRDREEQDAEAIREELGITANNLRVRLHRARLLLRDCLEVHWFDAKRGRTPRSP